MEIKSDDVRNLKLKVIYMKSDDEAKTGNVYLNQNVAKNNKTLVINKKQFNTATNDDIKHDEIALNLFMRQELKVFVGDTIDVYFNSDYVKKYVQPPILQSKQRKDINTLSIKIDTLSNKISKLEKEIYINITKLNKIVSSNDTEKFLTEE